MSARKPIDLLNEKLNAIITAKTDELRREISAHIKEFAEAMTLASGQVLPDDEELGSSAEFIHDGPESSASSSDEEEEEEEEEHEDEDEEPDVFLLFDSDEDVGRKRPGTKATTKRVSLKPQVGKRERKRTRRFSPSRMMDDEEEYGSEALSGSEDENRLDTDQWRMVRHLTRERRGRNPWYVRKVGQALTMVRSALGREGPNNQGPRDLWDMIATDPSEVEFVHLPTYRETKCAFCGQKKKCAQKIEFGTNHESYYLGSACARLARAWQTFSEVLIDARLTEWSQIRTLLGDVEAAHAAKAAKEREK